MTANDALILSLYIWLREVKGSFDKKVHSCLYQAGQLVLKRYFPIYLDPRGKLTPNYEGPFVVKKAFSGGDLILTTMDGDDFLAVNSYIVKKYYA